MHWFWFALMAMLALTPQVIEIRPALETMAVSDNPDDPAIWVNPQDAGQSLVIGTVKRPAPDGALAVFTLDGKLIELISGIDRPNNVDVRGDICVVTERLRRQLRVYRIHPSKPHLRLLGTVPVFRGELLDRGAPMGIALYERPRDKALFATVSRKAGPPQNYLWQYRLFVQGERVSGQKVREFGAFSGAGEIEAVATDHAAGRVYYADEDCCVRMYSADPDARGADREVARFAETNFGGNREGIAVAGGYVIVSEQLLDGSKYHVFKSTSLEEIKVWQGTAESTDGIDAIASALGPHFPNGLLVAMNNSRRNFQFYRWPMP